MIKHFAADGSVKQSWSDAVSASPIVRGDKTLIQVQGSNFVLAEVELGDGEHIGTGLLPVIAQTPAAPPIELPPSTLAPEPVAQKAAAVAELGKVAELVKELAEDPAVAATLKEQGLKIDHEAVSQLRQEEAVRDLPAATVAPTPTPTQAAPTQEAPAVAEPIAPTAHS